ncbi:MAG: AsmA family protein [Oricola sp.]
MAGATDGTTMKARAARIGLWLAAAFVIAVLVSWMLLPLFVSSEFVRNAIERELADITGQHIRVDGRVDLDLFPSPIARLYDLHVPRDPGGSGGSRTDLLSVETVEVGIPLSSLMAHEPAFSQFRLIRPVLRIAVGGGSKVDIGSIGGRLGRAIAGLEAGGAAGGEQAARRDAMALRYARLGTVTIANGTVEFIGPTAEPPEKVTEVNGTISWPRLSDRLTTALSGIWRGTAFVQKGEIDEAIRFFAGEITGVRTSFTSDTLSYSFDGRMGAGPTPFAEGAVTMNTPSVHHALDWLQLGVQPGGVVGDVALKGTVKADPRKIRFENLSLSLQGNSGMGVLELAFKEGAKPALTATLDFVQMDIVSFLSAFTGSPSQAADLGKPASPSIIDQLDVDLRLSAANARAGGLTLANIAAVTQIRNGSAVFEMADATAYGGQAQALLKIVREKGALTATVGISANGVNSAAVADALGLAGLFPRGIASGKLNVTAPLKTWDDIMKRAKGTLELRVANGTIAGVGFKTLGGGSEPRTFFRLQNSSVTGDVFKSLAVDALVQDGVIIVDNGSVDYADGTVLLNGVIPYGTASIALTTIAQPRDADIPASQHFIGGSWSNPYATPVLVPQGQP